MIVVAIIGILAAVAIPGFMKYIKDSKTSEAKVNVKAIAEGAVSFFQTEHPTNAKGTAFFTRQYPSATYCKASAGIDAGGGCTGLANMPTAIMDRGTKAAGTWTAEPWKSLNFQTSGPVYYTYSYSGIAGTGTTTTSFTAQGAAKLDSPTKVDSCFQIAGDTATDGDPNLTAIKDLSDAATACAILSGS